MPDLKLIPTNPVIILKTPIWLEIQALLDNDKYFINNLCYQWPAEPIDTYNNRKSVFFDSFVNPVKDMINTPVAQIFKNGVDYGCKDTNSLQQDFNQNVTGTHDNISLSTYMQDSTAPDLKANGVVYTEIKVNPLPVSASKADQRKNGIPYITDIKPYNVVNMRYGSDGRLDWFAYNATIEDDIWGNPFLVDIPQTQKVQCLWTRHEFIMRSETGQKIESKSFEHFFGFVPIVIQTAYPDNITDFVGNSSMEHTVKLIIQSNNLLNGATHELYKHGGALLLMPEDSAYEKSTLVDEYGRVNLKTHNDNGLLIVKSNEDRDKPEYLIKDIQTENFEKLATKYMQYAYENEKNAKSIAKTGSNGASIAQSGFAKMLDRDPQVAQLSMLVSQVMNWAKNINNRVAEILKINNTFDIIIDKTFDLKSQSQKIEDIKLLIDAKTDIFAPNILLEAYMGLVPHFANDPKMQQQLKNQIINNPVYTENTDILDRLSDNDLKSII